MIMPDKRAATTKQKRTARDKRLEAWEQRIAKNNVSLSVDFICAALCNCRMEKILCVVLRLEEEQTEYCPKQKQTVQCKHSVFTGNF